MKLSNVTGIFFCRGGHKEAGSILDKCGVEFGEVHVAPAYRDRHEFARAVNYEAWRWVSLEFAMVMHSDGYPTHPECWDDDFLNWDFIGAPWPESLNRDRVGNDGFCLKSRRLMHRVKDLGFCGVPSDVLVCSVYRSLLISEGMRFAPLEVAARFSVETRIPETPEKTFGFHGGEEK